VEGSPQPVDDGRTLDPALEERVDEDDVGSQLGDGVDDHATVLDGVDHPDHLLRAQELTKVGGDLGNILDEEDPEFAFLNGRSPGTASSTSGSMRTLGAARCRRRRQVARLDRRSGPTLVGWRGAPPPLGAAGSPTGSGEWAAGFSTSASCGSGCGAISAAGRT
jgi:hypothetical protein